MFCLGVAAVAARRGSRSTTKRFAEGGSAGPQPAEDQELAHAPLHVWPPARIWQRTEVRRSVEKGRTLHTTVALEEGALAFVEEPLIASIPDVAPELFEDVFAAVSEVRGTRRVMWRRGGNMEPRFYFAGLLAATRLQGQRLDLFMRKHVPRDRLDCRVERLLLTMLQDPPAVDADLWHFATLVFASNGFMNFRDEQGLTIYEAACFMNHSCDPSVRFVEGAAKDSIACFATRPLTPGTELTFNYLGATSKGVTARRDALLNWNIDCTCERCLAEADAFVQLRE